MQRHAPVPILRAACARRNHDGEIAETTTAQRCRTDAVMMTLSLRDVADFCQRVALLRLDPGLLDQGAPLIQFGLVKSSEFIGCRAHDNHALLLQPPPD